ncbi:MAG TPA: ABC transporter permease [Acidimicrobiales bacterium]|nr:ABC transporter permease [Acidimicrobiales bacterium]
MWKYTLKSLFDRKLRLALTMLAIVLGVSFTVASFVVADSMRATFDKLVGDIEQGVDLTARTKLEFGEEFNRPPISDEYLAAIKAIPGVRAAQLDVNNYPVVPIKANGENVKTMGPPLLGVNYPTEPSMTQVIQSEGRAPSGPTEFNLDIDSGEDNDFVVGQEYTVIGPSRSQVFTLVGTFAFNSEGNDTVGAVISAFDTATAQDFLDRPGSANEIDIQLADGANEAEVGRLVQAVLPDTVEVVGKEVKIEEQRAEFAQFADIFGTILLVFAAIIVFVSAFIINNTFQIVLGQRVRELGLLRALGASSKQVRRSVLGEALLIGLAASVAGTLLGIVLGQGVRALIASTAFPLPDGPTQLKIRTLIAALVVGVGVTTVSAIAPALRTRKLSPIDALQADARLAGSGLRRRVFIGTTVSVLGLVLLGLGLFGDLATTTLLLCLAVGALLAFIGVNLLSPLVARPVARTVGRSAFGWIFVVLGAVLAIAAVAVFITGIVQLIDGAPAAILLSVLVAPIILGLAWLSFDGGRGSRGLTGRLARENAARNPRRTASTAAALMIGLALVSMSAVVGESLKKSFVSTLDNAVQADWFIRNESGFDPTASLPPEYTERLRALPEVDSVVTYRFAWDGIRVAGDQKDVNATDYPLLSRHIDIDVIEGGTDNAPETGILVHQDSAKDNDLAIGSPVEVTFPDGSAETLTVAAIYKDATILGNWVISNATWNQHFARQQDQFITLRLNDDADPAAARTAIETVGKDFPQANAEDRVEFKKTQQQQVDFVLNFINVFLLLSVIIAFVGIVNTMSLSVFERTRELGLLRAVGTTRPQLGHMIKWEAAIVALLGGLLGIVLGILFGLAAVAAVPDSFIRSTSIPVGQLLIYIVFAGLAGLVAAWFPARRAAKLNVLDAISYT